MALRYFVNGGVDNNWGTSGNWSASSGGAGGAGVPTAADDVFFDASSPNCTVNASARVCLTLNFTGYTNTITMTFGITVSGNITLIAGLLVAGAGSLTCNANATITSNGFAWPNAFDFIGTGAGITFTISGDFQVNGLVRSGISATTPICIFNGDRLICNGGLTVQHRTRGTSEIIAQNGTYNCNSSAVNICSIGNNFSIVSTGTVTLALINIDNGNSGTKTFKYVSGTVVTTSFQLFVGSALTMTHNIDFNGISCLTASMFSNTTITLQSDMNVRTTLSPNGTINGASYQVNCGGLTYSSFGGTSKVTLRGNNTVSGITYVAGTINGGSDSQSIQLNTEINGNVTFGANVRFSGNITVTYISGVITVGTNTVKIGLTIGGNAFTITFALSSQLNLYDLRIETPTTNGGPTVVINGAIINITNQLTITTSGGVTNSPTFQGTHGWTVNILNVAMGNTSQVTLQELVTYTVTGQLILQGPGTGTPFNFYSSDPSAPYTNRAIFTLSHSASQSVYFVRARGIDSGLGQTIWDVPGTISPLLTDTINWNPGTQPPPIMYSFIQ